MLPDLRKVDYFLQKKGYFGRIPIRFKITIPYLFLVLVFSFGVAVLSSRIILETVDERFTNQLYEAGKIASEAVVKEEARLLSTLRLLANMQGIPEAVERGDPEALRALSLGSIINNGEEFVAFLYTDGSLILSLNHRKGGLIEEYEGSTGGTAYAELAIVRKVRSGIADRYGDKFADSVKTDRDDFFIIAGPIRNSSNDLVGVILIGKSLSRLARQIREETLSQVTFYDLVGMPLASTFPNPSVLDPTTVSEILARQDQNSYRRNSNRRDFQSLDLNYGEIIGPWEIRGDADLGALGISLIKNTLITASIPTRIQVTALITLVVAIILLVGINLSALITQPLMHLVKASKAVAGGNFQVVVPVTTKDEIADVATSFNQMIESLQQSKTALIESYDKTLNGWSKALELRDHETQGHSQRVTQRTLALAKKLGLSDEQLSNIYRGATLHDIGKMGIPDEILLKEGPLTAKEWAVMRYHPQYAVDMLGDIDYLKPALEIPYCHHEKWDGSGYPRGLKGNEIPLAARLFAIVDVWDALTSDRPYRKRMEAIDALRFIRAGSGSHFDPELVALFFEHFVESDLVDNGEIDRQVLDTIQTKVPNF